MHTHCWRAEVCICNHAPGSGGVAFQRPTSLRRQMTIQPISKPWAEPLLGLLFFSSELLISMVTTLCATNYAPGNGNSPPAFLVWDVLNWYRTYFRSNKQKWNCLISSSSCTWNLWWAYNMLVLCLEWTSPFPHIMTLCNIPRQHWVYKQPQQSTSRRRPPTQGCWAQRLYWPQVARLMWIVDMCSMKLSLRRGRVEPENIAYLLMSWRPTEPIREPFVLFTTSSALCYQQRRKIESWLCLLVLLDMWMTHDVNFLRIPTTMWVGNRCAGFWGIRVNVSGSNLNWKSTCQKNCQIWLNRQKELQSDTNTLPLKFNDWDCSYKDLRASASRWWAIACKQRMFSLRRTRPCMRTSALMLTFRSLRMSLSTKRRGTSSLWHAKN